MPKAITILLAAMAFAGLSAIHAASAAGDLEKERQLFSADMVIEEPPYLPYGGTFHGYEGFLRLFRECSSFCELASTPAQFPHVLDAAVRTAVETRGVSVLVVPGAITAIATEQWRVEKGLAVHCRISWFDATPAKELREP